jgi:hypothetical protein
MNARIRRTLAAIEESVQETDYRVASSEYAAETHRIRDERYAFGRACYTPPLDPPPFNPSAMYKET